VQSFSKEYFVGGNGMKTGMKQNGDVQRVQLNNGKKMNYFKTADNRHVFLGDVVAMNIWMVALLIFILLSSIMIGFYQISQQVEIGNILLRKLHEMDTCNDFKMPENPGAIVIEPVVP
jgi:hypothetical protein